MHFGSDYIYAADRPFAHVVTNRAGRVPYPTFARGGFSNIWGAAVLPPDACDMADWPVSRGAMKPYFRKVAALLPLCGDGGSMAATFPAYKETSGRLDPGPQGVALLADLARAEKRLAADGVLYGPARLAVHTTAAEDGALPCNGCGRCFTGCVRGSIFSTLPMLDGMVRRGEVVYRGGLFVRSIKEDADQARVEVLDLNGGPAELTFKAIFVAAGPLSTTAILLRSAAQYERPVSLKESQKFVLPALRRHAAHTAAEQPSITLAAAFIEAKVPELSDHWLHVQMIPMNDMVITGSRLPIEVALRAPALDADPAPCHAGVVRNAFRSFLQPRLILRRTPINPTRYRLHSMFGESTPRSGRCRPSDFEGLAAGRPLHSAADHSLFQPRFRHPLRISFPMRSRPATRSIPTASAGRSAGAGSTPSMPACYRRSPAPRSPSP